VLPPATVPPPLAVPPALLRPLATPAMVLHEQPATEEHEIEDAEVLEDPSTVEPVPPSDPGLPLEAYPLARCAAIAASLARRKPDAAAILAEHALSRSRWEALTRHWQDAIRAESARGQTTLLSAYDDAYVAQLEAERGPIRVEEHARLLVATERGAESDALTALSLPPGAGMRLSRVWARRIAADAELGKAVRDAIEAAREA
jgi:hypothetical protein